MVAKDNRGRTWSEVAVRNAGFREGLRAFSFATEWALVTAELGREPESVEELAEHAGCSRRTAFRQQAAFRKAFPTEVSPARMNETSGQLRAAQDLVRKLRSAKGRRGSLNRLSDVLMEAAADI